MLFVVDRKDLDYQTIKEYDRYEKGCASGNTSTKVLQRQMSDRDEHGGYHKYSIIITTIQKLSVFVKKNKNHPARNKQTVIIFDECHRSQFGRMHREITKFFRKYYLFGFTGTPIYAQNASSANDPRFATTPQLFGDCLHKYTIVDAIRDGNVLPFKIDYVNTVKEKDFIENEQISAVDKEKALMSPDRISKIVGYTLKHFSQKTRRSSCYSHDGERHRGFSAMFVCQSIPAAVRYYREFQKQNGAYGYRIATIFSYAPNENDEEDESMDTDGLDSVSKEALFSAMEDYDAMFKTNFAVSGSFENYYKDISLKMKTGEIDLLIVVNMFTTGANMVLLNSIFIDRNLKDHGLIQTFSRANRILNSVKIYANIICFRDISKNVEEAFALYGSGGDGGLIVLKDYKSYYCGYTDNKGTHPGYLDIAGEILEKYPKGRMPFGESDEKHFIRLFGSLLRIMNILSSFDEFDAQKIISDRQMQDYQSVYLDLYHNYRSSEEKTDINDDIIFEITLVKQTEVNIDYILKMVRKYRDENMEDRDAYNEIMKAVGSSTKTRSKKELIEKFINEVDYATDDDWHRFAEKEYRNDVEKLILRENLKPGPAEKFIAECLEGGYVKTTGTDIDACLPPMSRFAKKANERKGMKKEEVLRLITALFEKYEGII